MIDIETRKSPVYEGDGSSTGPYSFDFRIWDDTQVIVVTAKSSELRDVKTVRILEPVTDFTVTLNDDGEGGYITLTEPLEKGRPLVILSGIPYLQPLGLERLGTFNPDDLVAAWDRNCALIQQLCERLSRAVVIPPTVKMHPYKLVCMLIQAALDAKKSAEAAEDYWNRCQAIWELIHEYSWDIPHLVPTIQAVRDYPHDGYFWVPGMAPTESRADISNRFVVVDGEEKTIGEWISDLVHETGNTSGELDPDPLETYLDARGEI